MNPPVCRPHLPGPSFPSLLSIMQPFSPQVWPRLILSFQKSLPQPTITTPKSTEKPQSPLNTPDLQNWKSGLSVSMAAEIGQEEIACLKALLLNEKAEHSPILQISIDGLNLQLSFEPEQGYCYSVVIPVSMPQNIPWLITPPLQPQFPQLSLQSINCWAEIFLKILRLPARNPSTAPAVENAQLAPQLPSVLTALTYFLVQSTCYGMVAFGIYPLQAFVTETSIGLAWICLNSQKLRCAYSFRAREQLRPCAL